MDYEHFGEWVRALRVEMLRETQDQLGDCLGVHAFTISRWERNQTRPHSSSLEALRNLAEQVGFVPPPPDIDRRIGPRA